jgi:hypothetical protein
MTAAPVGCSMGNVPSVVFKKGAVQLSSEAMGLLASTADRLKNNPTCKLFVTGYAQSTKASQQLSWDRVNAVINYLVEKQGIAAERLINQYGQGDGDINTVDFSATSENTSGPNTVPAPHPNLRKN